jgi:hypothetical protein
LSHAQDYSGFFASAAEIAQTEKAEGSFYYKKQYYSANMPTINDKESEGGEGGEGKDGEGKVDVENDREKEVETGPENEGSDQEYRDMLKNSTDDSFFLKLAQLN